MANKQAQRQTASRLIGPAVKAYKAQCVNALPVESAKGLIDGDMYILPPSAADRAAYTDYPDSEIFAVILVRARNADHTMMFPKGEIRNAAFKELMTIDDEPFRAVYDEIFEAFGERYRVLKQVKEQGGTLSTLDQQYLAQVEADTDGTKQADGTPVAFEPNEAEALGNSPDLQI